MKTSVLSKTETSFSVEIESLRGIAAILVLLGHFYILINLPQFFPPISSVLLKILLNSIFNPQPPVLLFFTISGLVLGRQLRKKPIENLSSFIAYLVQRFFRLIPLVWITSCFAFSLNYIISRPDFSVLSSMLLLDNISFNVPLWSLKVELWCSIFFPILFWMVTTIGVTYNILLFLVLVLLSYFWREPIFMQFWVFFHAGLLIDFFHPNLKSFKLGMLALACSYLVFILAPEFSMGSRSWAYGCWQSWVIPEILACFFILFFVVHYKDSLFNYFLRLSWIRYLGKISFSIYLLHFPLLQFLLIKFPIENKLQLIIFTSSYLGLVILLASITYYWVEIPFNSLGKSFYGHILLRPYSKTLHDNSLPE